MVLAFDIGNSTIALAVFDGDKKLASLSLPSSIQRSPEETWALFLAFLSEHSISPDNIHSIGISSVVPSLTSTLKTLFNERLDLDPLIINGGMNLGISIQYTDPLTLGSDRLCSAVAGFRKYGGPLIIIDFGTATTYGVVNENGDFIGGSISLGLLSSAEMLHRRTAQLPAFELQFPESVLAKDTTSAMQAGIMFSAIDAMEGMVKRIRKALNADARVIATGGLATTMEKYTSTFDAVEPELVLAGVRIICEKVIQ